MLVDTRARLSTYLESFTLLYNNKKHHLSDLIPRLSFFVCLHLLTDVLKIKLWIPIMPAANWGDYYQVLTDGTIT